MQSSGRAPLSPHMCSLTVQPSTDPRWHRGVLPHAPVQAFISAMPSSVLNSQCVMEERHESPPVYGWGEPDSGKPVTCCCLSFLQML